jgi:hypothetical protein
MELNKSIKNSPDSLVPAITSIVTAWARALDDVVGDDANEAWTEELLEKIKENRGQLKMVLQVCGPLA